MRATTVGLALVLAVVVGGCGRPKTFNESVIVERTRTTIESSAARPHPVIRVDAAAVKRWNETVLVNAIVANAGAAAQEARTPPPSEVVVSVVDWPCVAEAETGSDWSMHGSVYSTAYGMVNAIIYEYASPAVQQRVFSGSASAAEQTDIAARFAADHGTGGWGARTREKCGL